MSVPPRVLIPLRSLDAGKSRLSAVLTVAERQALIEAMLTDVITAVHGAELFDVVLAANGRHATELADRLGIPWIPDSNATNGLNAALHAAIRRDATTHPELMIVAADLPFINASDLRAVVAATGDVVIAPTHDGGTAVLKLRPPGVIQLAYGRDSAAQHAAHAAAVGAHVSVVNRPGFAFDLDTPGDLIDAVARCAAEPSDSARGTHTRGVLMRRQGNTTATLPTSP